MQRVSLRHGRQLCSMACWSSSAARLQHALQPTSQLGAAAASRQRQAALTHAVPLTPARSCRQCTTLAAQPAAADRAAGAVGGAAARAAVVGAAEAASPGNAGAPHVPVLLDEVLSFFHGRPLEVYVDGTLGAGGHASALLRQHPELHTLVGFDLDTTAHAIAAVRLQQAGAHVLHMPHGGPPHSLSNSSSSSSSASSSSNAGPGLPSALLTGSQQQLQQQQPTAYIAHSNFGAMQQVLERLPGGSLVGGVDGILLDLGVSSMQLDMSERGFSFLRDGPLDMRMDPGASLSAELLINTWPEQELGRIFREFGEERHWRAVARRIAAAREQAPITTTQQLVAAIGNTLGSGGSSSGGKRRRGGGGSGSDGGGRQKHPATRVFQAIRIAVNGELASVAAAVPDAIACLKPGGRLAVITFHSLEDRIVKWAFRRAAGMAPSDEPLPSYCLPPVQQQQQAAAAAAAAVAGRGGGGAWPRRSAAAARQASSSVLPAWEEGEQQPAQVKILTRRPVGPSEEEERANPRSRSAKLRVVEKL